MDKSIKMVIAIQQKIMPLAMRFKAFVLIKNISYELSG